MRTFKSYFGEARSNKRKFLLSCIKVLVAGAIGASSETSIFGLDENTKDSNTKEFLDYLSQLTDEERIQLSQSLQMFPKIQENDFGKYGLYPSNTYAKKPTDVSAEHPIKPITFNELPASFIKSAIEDRRLDKSKIKPSEIVSELLKAYDGAIVGRAVSVNSVNYHEVVQWVATKKGVKSNLVNLASTFQLEQEIHKKYLEGLWDKLTIEQREKILKDIEAQSGTPIANKSAIAAMAGGAAIGTLGATVAMTGFAFYTTMATVVCSAAAFFGITLPFTVYTTMASTVALLSGPVGWAIAGICLAGGTAWLAWPNVERAAAFVMSFNVIKARKFNSNKKF